MVLFPTCTGPCSPGHVQTFSTWDFPVQLTFPPSPPDTFKQAVGMRAVGIRWKCLFVPVAFENYAKCSANMRKLHPADKEGTVPGATIGKRLIRVRGGFLKVAGPFLNHRNKNWVQTWAMINTGKTPELIYWRYIKRFRKSGLMVELYSSKID